MRESHKTDSPLCGGQPGHFQSGDIHFGKCYVPPHLTHFSSTMRFLRAATNQTLSASVSFSPPAHNSNCKRCGAMSSLKTNKQHNTTETSHGESLGMDYLSLNTHTPSSISLFFSQHVLFRDPNYNFTTGRVKDKSPHRRAGECKDKGAECDGECSRWEVTDSSETI